MENKEVFVQLYRNMKYPSEFEGYLFPVFEVIVTELQTRLDITQINKKNIDLSVCLKYLVEEHMYNMSMMNEEYMNKFMLSKDYTNHLFLIVVDKIFFNIFIESIYFFSMFSGTI